MPIYEYRCSDCEKHLEIMQKISDEPLSVCQECGGSLSKLISNTSFVLKGGGWYSDGYCSSGKDASKDASSVSAKGGTDGKKDSAGKTASDSKGPDSKGSDSKGSDSKAASKSKSKDKAAAA